MAITTHEFISYLTQKRRKIDYTLVEAYANSVLKCGTKIDADLILEYFISKPIEFHDQYILSILEKWGNHEYAEKIVETHLKNNRLINPYFPEVLELLGKLKCERAETALIHYAFNDDNDYYTHKFGVLGLIHFDCNKIESLIRSSISKTIGKSFFNDEFTPALVFKLSDYKNILLKLYESGRTYCSSDCNSGIILGFSLCGKDGLNYFMDVLYNHFWEASGQGTGNARFVYQGLINLNISLSQFYQDIKKKTDLQEQKNGVEVLLALIEIRVSEPYSAIELESFVDLHTNLFAWKNENKSNNLVDLARKFDLENKAYELKKLIQFNVREELLLKNYTY